MDTKALEQLIDEAVDKFLESLEPAMTRLVEQVVEEALRGLDLESAEGASKDA